jgi:CRP/FNR family transcriptional regulator, anaerobic regulatory protein
MANHSNALIAFLQNFNQLPEEIAAEIGLYTFKQELPKKTLLLKAGRICDQIWFLERGLARNFSEVEGKVYTNDIVIDGELFGSFGSFVSREPSSENIELLEDSVLYHITYDALQELYRKFPQMERTGRLIAERYYLSLASQTQRLRTMSSAERYNYLFENKPEIVKRAPIGVIASYLGMTIETLSRVRGREG